MQFRWYLPASRPSTGSAPPRLRRALGRLGPTWAASPLRRTVQAVCFAAFLWLFFVVCWPYTARPARTWNDWIPVHVDTVSGAAQLQREPAADPIPPDLLLYVTEGPAANAPLLGRFRVAKCSAEELQLAPDERLSADQLDRLASSFGPWSLHETPPGEWPSHYTEDLRAKERVPAELFLALDPLVSLSTALASRSWIWSLGIAGAAMAVCLILPRAFCAYVCPLGTLIDLFDWAVSRRIRRFRVRRNGAWSRTRHYLLAATLAASLGGVLISGFVAAIPVVTRALAFLAAPLQTGASRGWHQVPPVGPGHLLSVGLFVLILALGLLGPRFWCKYVCPTGALFSLGNLFRINQRSVAARCIGCGKCVDHCSFDAIDEDFDTRAGNCSFCQTCGGVCPTQAIEFGPRWPGAKADPASLESDAVAGAVSPRPESRIDRRALLGIGLGLAAGGGLGLAAATGIRAFGANLGQRGGWLPVRPPGSLPELEFLQCCVRCGECFRACPNDVLQPLGFEQGLEGLWTPQVVADWSGCETSCNRCGQVCPTGAIRALPLEEKRAARMGLAVVNERTCLPLAHRGACQLCVDECRAAGYDAIEFVRVGTEVDSSGQPIEDSGFLAPVVLRDKCVGCGLCQTRCHAINVRQKQLLTASAILVEAGDAKDDRLREGSYRALRKAEAERQKARIPEAPADEGYYLPDFLDP